MNARFQLAANVLLSRRLKNLVRIEENVAIDLSYITCAEYQLFIDEKRQAGENHQPAHWQDYRFPPGDAQKPITGVRASDAHEFCEWLTQRQSTLGFRYRLPTFVEAEENPTTELQIGCWCHDKGEEVIAGIEQVQWQEWQSNLAKVDLDPYFDLNLNLYFGVNFSPSPYFGINFNRNYFLYEDFDIDLNRVLNLDFKFDLKQVLKFDLKRVLNRNLNRDLNSKLNFDIALNVDLNHDLKINILLDFNSNFDLNIKIEECEATDCLLLCFPLLVVIRIYYLLSLIYKAVPKSLDALLQIKLSIQKCQSISRKYQEKIYEIYPLYVYLLLQNERQAGRIPA
ncbi:MAG: SUMF1/EgtB/PvdO family nonheme iron enzyme [Symploca sp. SIO1B1]|nr:SUMF1/EgtB/PvdO family nonheme iron enzyme [Symploca sp. SIO1B1]